jgi:hypothetical protein
MGTVCFFGLISLQGAVLFICKYTLPLSSLKHNSNCVFFFYIKITYFPRRLYLCVTYGSQNSQGLFPYSSRTKWTTYVMEAIYITAFWDVMSCSLIVSNVSEERGVEEWKPYVPPER